MTNIETLKEELNKHRERMQKLEAEVKTAETEVFAKLPAQYGFASMDSLIKALAPYASPRFKGAFAAAFGDKPAKAAKKAAKNNEPKPPKAASKKRARATITDEIRQGVIAAAKTGQKSGAAIAKEFGISLPSVMNIKKAAGLVKARKAK